MTIKTYDRLSVYFVLHEGEKESSPFPEKDIVHVATAFAGKQNLAALKACINSMLDNMSENLFLPEVEFKKIKDANKKT